MTRRQPNMEIPGREKPVVKPPGLRDWGGGKDGTPRYCTGQTPRAFYFCLNISSCAFFKGQVRKPPSRLSSLIKICHSQSCATPQPYYTLCSAVYVLRGAPCPGVRSPLYCTCVGVWVYACVRGGWRATLGIILQVSFSLFFF